MSHEPRSGEPRDPPAERAVEPAHADFRLDSIAAEAMFMLGAGSTVMYQLAMKGVGLGVVEHSTTLSRPVDRLRTTLTYVYVMVLGTDEEKDEFAGLVNRMHAPVRSPGRYSAFDPELQLWVAATLARNSDTLYERVFGTLSEAARERLYRDSWILGTALQVRTEAWPQTRREFERYWEESLGRLESDPHVQVYAARLVSMDGAPWYLRPARPLQSLMTRGNLDPHTRAILALPWSARDQRAYDLFWRVFPPVYRMVPRRLRQLPACLLLRDVRRRLRRGARVI